MTKELSKKIKFFSPKTLIFFASIELIITLFFNKIEFREITAILYFISGILVAVIASKQSDKYIIYIKLRYNIVIILYLIFFGYFIYELNKLFKQVPLYYKWADMLPIIKIMSERFLHQENVYEIIPEIWNGMTPIYLPMMFLPYCIGILLKIDIRWIGILFLFISLLLLLYQKKQSIYKFITLSFVIFFILESLHHNNQIWYTLTEEPLVYAYYILLGIGIYKKNIALLIFSIVACLLSRYVLLFWIPFYIIFLYLNNHRKEAKYLIVFIPILALILMWVTGAIYNLDIFLNVPSGYLKNMYSIDKINEFQYSLGLLRFVSYTQVHILYYANIILMILIPFLSLLFYIKFKQHINQKLFPIAVLKIGLVFFYNLLTTPYYYLFITSTLFSLVIINFYIDSNIKESK